MVRFIEYKRESTDFFDLFKKIMEEESINSFESLDTYINKINPAFSNFSLFQSFIEKTSFYDKHHEIGIYDWHHICNPLELNDNLEQVTLRRFVSLDAGNNEKLDIGSISFLGLKNKENKYIVYELYLIGCAPPESIAVLSEYAHKMISFIESNKEDPQLKEFCAQCYWAQMIAQAGIYNEKKNHEKMLNDEMLNDNIDIYGKGLSEFFSHKYGLTFGPNFAHRMPFVMTLEEFVSYFVENVTP
jgi:hypothetical protein